MPFQPRPAHRWDIRFFRRHRDEDLNQSVPALEFLRSCPEEVAKKFLRILESVASAPPPAWTGGGYWEAMHDDMAGYCEVRARMGKVLYRLFCFLERDVEGLERPSIVVITGMAKKNESAFRPADYARVRDLGDEYRRRTPRSLY